jgi:hypothetical protein
VVSFNPRPFRFLVDGCLGLGLVANKPIACFLDVGLSVNLTALEGQIREMKTVQRLTMRSLQSLEKAFQARI